MSEPVGKALEQKVVEVLDHVVAWVEKAEDLAGAHAPAVVEEIITRGLWNESSHAVVGAGIITILFVIRHLALKWVNEMPDIYKNHNGREVDQTEDKLAGMRITHIVSLIVMTFAGGVWIRSVYDVVRIFVAPKLYVLEYLRGFF